MVEFEASCLSKAPKIVSTVVWKFVNSLEKIPSYEGKDVSVLLPEDQIHIILQNSPLHNTFIPNQ